MSANVIALPVSPAAAPSNTTTPPDCETCVFRRAESQRAQTQRMLMVMEPELAALLDTTNRIHVAFAALAARYGVEIVNPNERG